MSAQYPVLDFVEDDMMSVSFQLVDNTTGTPVAVNITGYTLVLQVQRADKSVLSKTGSITDAANGRATFTFGATDLSFTGLNDAQLKITDNAGNTWRGRGFGFNIAPAFK